MVGEPEGDSGDEEEDIVVDSVSEDDGEDDKSRVCLFVFFVPTSPKKCGKLKVKIATLYISL